MPATEAKEKSGECRCHDCAGLCGGKPGWFTPGQATKAAASIGMKLADFFRTYLTRDFYVRDYSADKDGDHSTRVYLLSPAWNKNNGKTAAYNDVNHRGACALLTPTGCRLSFENRPTECQLAYGCTPRWRGDIEREQSEIVAEWLKTPGELAECPFDPADDGGHQHPPPVRGWYGPIPGWFTR